MPYNVTITMTDLRTGRFVNSEHDDIDISPIHHAEGWFTEMLSQLDDLNSVPVWQDYDVISVKFRPEDSRLYTYMRRDGWWPGNSEERATGLKDYQIDEMYLEGRVEVLARDGKRWTKYMPFTKASDSNEVVENYRMKIVDNANHPESA
jgi:hypothetical protein